MFGPGRGATASGSDVCASGVAATITLSQDVPMEEQIQMPAELTRNKYPQLFQGFLWDVASYSHYFAPLVSASERAQPLPSPPDSILYHSDTIFTHLNHRDLFNVVMPIHIDCFREVCSRAFVRSWDLSKQNLYLEASLEGRTSVALRYKTCCQMDWIWRYSLPRAYSTGYKR
jgi:hypothetical protein